jgi:transposase
MKIDKMSVNETLNKAGSLLKEEQGLSPAMKAMFEIIILLICAFASRFSINSNNSSMPPSADKKRKRGSSKEKSGKKPGGQNGHQGFQLEKSDNPDEIIDIKVDKTTLPLDKYQDIGYEARQVIDFVISKIVTEYRAQILENTSGKQYTAEFPDYVKTDVQYGYRVKSHAVYLSQFQFLPYARAQSYFEEKMRISISAGSIFNFNKEAYLLLDQFDVKAVADAFFLMICY